METRKISVKEAQKMVGWASNKRVHFYIKNRDEWLINLAAKNGTAEVELAMDEWPLNKNECPNKRPTQLFTEDLKKMEPYTLLRLHHETYSEIVQFVCLLPDGLTFKIHKFPSKWNSDRMITSSSYLTDFGCESYKTGFYPENNYWNPTNWVELAE